MIRLKKFFRRPDSQPVELIENDVFQYGSSDESDCSSLATSKKRCVQNSKLMPLHDLPATFPSSSQMEESACPLESDLSVSSVSSEISPLPALHSKTCLSVIKPNSELKAWSAGKDQKFKDCVVTFQAISTERLILQISMFIPTLEKIKNGEVSRNKLFYNFTIKIFYAFHLNATYLTLFKPRSNC